MPEFATLIIMAFVTYYLAKAVLKAFHGGRWCNHYPIPIVYLLGLEN